MRKVAQEHIFCEKCKNSGKSLIKFCSIQEREEINFSKTCTTYKRGEFIFHNGGMPLGLYCVNSGNIKLVKEASGGKEQIVRIASGGDVIGYRSLLMQERYSASAVATEDCKVCFIPKEQFAALAANNRQFYDALIKMLCEDLERSQNKIAEIAYKPIRGRVAEALLILGQMSDIQGNINLTREDLASFVGTVKETVIRTLSEFKDERLIEIDKRNIKVLSTTGLERLSNLYD
jgi:CRP/FNR family transcriptional regulator, polysaccharide utilization system transcription regulator